MKNKLDASVMVTGNVTGNVPGLVPKVWQPVKLKILDLSALLSSGLQKSNGRFEVFV